MSMDAIVRPHLRSHCPLSEIRRKAISRPHQAFTFTADATRRWHPWCQGCEFMLNQLVGDGSRCRFALDTRVHTMRGTVRKISLPRRLIIDLMHASMRVPFVSLRRNLHIRPLVDARQTAAERPGWAAIFAKAFSLVARDEPVLRTLFVDWPWPYFYELPRSVGMIAIARRENGEDCVLPQKVAGADEMPLSEVDALIRHAKTAPIDQVPPVF
jgi:hypothetical protein